MAIQITPRKARREVEILITVSMDGASVVDSRLDHVFNQARGELDRARSLASVDIAAMDKELADKAAEIALRKANKLSLDLGD